MNVRPEDIGDDSLREPFETGESGTHPGVLGKGRTPDVGVQDDSMDRHGLVASGRHHREATGEKTDEKRQRGPKLATFRGFRECVKKNERVVAARFEHIDSATGPENPAALVDKALGFVQVVNDVAHEHVVERSYVERHRLAGGGHELTGGE